MEGYKNVLCSELLYCIYYFLRLFCQFHVLMNIRAMVVVLIACLNIIHGVFQSW